MNAQPNGGKIVLAQNNFIVNDPCILCGARCDPDGIDFMLDGTNALVCHECAEQHAPALWRFKMHAGGDEQEVRAPVGGFNDAREQCLKGADGLSIDQRLERHAKGLDAEADLTRALIGKI